MSFQQLIQNDTHRFEMGGGWSLTRIVRVGEHTIKARVDWGYHQNEGSSWVWTSVGWKQAVTLCTLYKQSKMNVAAITITDMNKHAGYRPPEALYDLFDQDATTLIEMTAAVLASNQQGDE